MKLILATLAALLALPAAAQMPCMARADLLKIINDKYGESVRMSGIVGTSSLIEVWGADGGSWTITSTNPNGVTCIVSAGRAFEVITAPDGDPL